VDKAVLTGQGERSDAAPASATAAVAADTAAVVTNADSPAVSAAAESSAVSAAAVSPAVSATADPAAVEAAAGPAAVATTAGPATAAGPASAAGPAAAAAAAADFPAAARAPRWANLPYAIVLALVAGGLSWVALGGLRHVQVGMITVASALLAAAVLRLVLPERAAGLLVTRHRLLDVLTLAGLGAGIMAAVLVLPAP
jgi:hypothetical protein